MAALSSLVLTLLAAAPAPAAARPADHVVIVMLDGVRPDALREASTPHLDALAEAGTVYWQASAPYPSQTRVSFVTLPTGSWPARHGIVGGDEILTGEWETVEVDSGEPEKFQHLVEVPTMFEEASAHGLTSLYAALKGYELVGARGATWTINGKNTIRKEWYATRYDDEVSGSRALALWDKLAISRDLLDQATKLVRENRPNLVVLNLGSADYAAHTWGPHSPEYRTAIEVMDALVGRLLATLDEIGMRGRTAIVVSSDHGFTQITPRRVIAPVSDESGHRLDVLAARGIEHFVTNAGGTAMGVYVRDDARVKEAVALLKAEPWADGVYCEVVDAGCDRTLSSLNAYHPRRSPAIMVDLDDDVALNRPRPGNHGSLRATDMSIPLLLSGAGVGGGRVFGEASLADVAPTAMRLLGITPSLMKVDGRVLEEALVP